MELIHPIVLWRELAAFFAILLVIVLVRFVDDHIRVRNPHRLHAVSMAVVLVCIVLVAQAFRAPLLGILGGLTAFFSLIKTIEIPHDPRFRRGKTAQ